MSGSAANVSAIVGSLSGVDESFWVSPARTTLEITSDPTTNFELSSYFSVKGTPGRLRFVRLDDNTVVTRNVKGSTGRNAPDTDQWARLGAIPWQANPVVLNALDPAHPIRTDPGRLAEGSNLIPGSLLGVNPPALPTQHFATPWMLQKNVYFPPGNLLSMYSTPEIATAPHIPATICSGPFVLRLEPDPLGNACMRLLATVEYEAGVEMLEATGAVTSRYTTANNGVVFLANTGYPWAVLSASPMCVVLTSPAGEDRGHSDRFVFITRGLLTIVYTGDAGGIVKNVTPVNVTSLVPLATGSPIPRGNTNSQFGYGSVGLGAERTFTKSWNTDLTDTIPQPPDPGELVPLSPSSDTTTPLILINEFLRLNTYSASDYLVYGYYVTDDTALGDSITRFDKIPEPNLNLALVRGMTAVAPPPVDALSVAYTQFEIDSYLIGVRPVVVAGSSLEVPFGSTSHPGSTITVFANQDTLFEDTKVYMQFTLADNITPYEYPVNDPIFTETSITLSFPPYDGTTLGYGPSAIASAGLSTDRTFALVFKSGATQQFVTRYPSASVSSFAYALAPKATASVLGTNQSHYESDTGTTIVIYGRNLTEYNLADHDPTYATYFTIDALATNKNSEQYYQQSLTRTLTAATTPPPGVMTISTLAPDPVSVRILSPSQYTTMYAQMPRFTDAFGPTGAGIIDQAAFPGEIVVLDGANFGTTGSITTVTYPLYGSVAPNLQQIASQVSGGALEFTLSSGTAPGFVLVTHQRPASGTTLGQTATGSFYMGKEIQPSINSNIVAGVTLGLGPDLDFSQATSPGGTTGNIYAYNRVQVTYYIGTTAAVAEAQLAVGPTGTVDEVARLVNPHSAFSVYVDYGRGRFPVNEDDGSVAPTSTEARVSLTTGHIWLPSNYGTLTNAIEYRTVPLQITFPGYTVPDFPSSGVPTTSAIGQDYVAAFPLREFGSTLDEAKIPGASMIVAAVGVKSATQDFQGTTDGDTRVNFRVPASNAVFPPTATNSAGSKAVLAWDPLFGPGGTPDIVTITRPNGYRIVRYTPGAGTVASAVGASAAGSPSEYAYTRIVSNQPGVFNSTIYTQRFTPTPAQITAREPGTPILSVDDCADVVTALNAEFSDPILGSDGQPDNDSYMWRGYEITRGATSDLRIRGDVLEWGRQSYRYARYIEMASRGAPGPYTGFINSDGVDQSAFIASGIADAAVKLWRGVRTALTSGFLPPWDLLTNYVRAPSPPSDLTGFDVSYAGANGAPALSRNATDLTGIVGLLIANHVTDPTVKAARIATYTYDGSTSSAALMTTLEKLALITPVGASAAAAKEQDLAAGPLNATSIMFASDFIEFGEWAQAAIRAEAFVFDYYVNFGQLRYDRAMCEDVRGTRSVWGGLTSRISHELWRWALILEDQADVPEITGRAPTDGYTGGATGPLNSVGYRVVQLRNIPQPLNSNAIDARFTEPAGFSFYSNHHRSYGYLLYAAYVALRYAPAATFVPDGGSGSVTIAEDIMSLLTSAKVTTRADGLSLLPDSACNTPEPYPLFQMLLDILSPACEYDVRASRGESLVGVDRSCQGVASPSAPDGVSRVYPAHRHFDAYSGHSWEPGAEMPYPQLYQEASGEAVLAYLGAYRFLNEIRNYDLMRARTLATPLRLPFMVGYLFDSASTGYFPRVAYAILAQEAAASEMYRSTRPLAGAAMKALALTAAGSGRFGYPVVASDAFLEAEMSKFISISFNTGIGRASVYTFMSLAYRSFPPKFLIELGSQLVPLTDVSYYLNSNTWSSLIAGDATGPKATFGGILSTYTNPAPPPPLRVFTVGNWLDEILCSMPLATTENIAPQAPIFQPTMDVQMWARFVTAALTHKPDARLSPALDNAVAFPGQYYDSREVDMSTGIRFGPPVPAPAITPSQQYPLPLTMGGYYLPQSSWFDVMTWMRFANAGTPPLVPRGGPTYVTTPSGESGPASGYPIFDWPTPYFMAAP